MKYGKVGLQAPRFLTRLFKGKTGYVPRCAFGFFPRPARPISRFQGQRRKGIWRSVVNVVKWMLLGFIIAGPNLPNLHSQDSRSARIADKKPETTSAKLRALEQPARAVEPAPRARASQPPRASAPSRREVVLPDIYIRVPADTIATLKKQLEQAERDLQQLQRERNRIIKTIEQFQQPSGKGASPPVPRTTALGGRPSV